ncbi:FHA domain-containing protein [Streptomyces sp. B6B3]|uniref:FHA domain-containing protein n=1 Tax=Streptomyces sp. B6B3 TaxID=3153570 RepID=UPI00325E8846
MREPPSSLAWLDDAAARHPGTLYARSIAGTVRVVEPRPGHTVRFGRNRPEEDPEVDLAVGFDDEAVSRRHGELTFARGHWSLRNIGQQVVRLPRGRLVFGTSEPVDVGVGYTPLFVKGTGYREHLVELYVAGHRGRISTPAPGTPTVRPERWPLDEEQRLVLVTLGQDYLRNQPDPRPWSYREASELLRDLYGKQAPNKRRVAKVATDVRERLGDSGRFPYKLRREDPGDPCDNNLLHNLITGLVESTTLVPTHLVLLDGEEPG